MSKTLGQALSGAGARDNAFDTIRLFAASAVIVSHSFALTMGTDLGEPFYRLTQGRATLGLSAVGLFFIVSGLLISMSFDRRKSLPQFMRNRALRLFPGLWVCTLLTVLVLGPLLTKLSLIDYVKDRQTWRFLGALVFLPFSTGMGGMFPDHPYPHAVNGSLWTLKYEVACYIGGAILLSAGRWRRAFVLLVWLISMIGSLCLGDPHQHSGLLYHLTQFLWLFRFYGAGMLCYLYRDHIMLHAGWGWLATLAVTLALVTPWFTEALAIGGSYSLMVLAYRAPGWVRGVTRGGDLSYGVYIYAFPIQQMLVPLSLGFRHPQLANMLFSFPLVLLLAWLSWRKVEAPALRYKGSALGSPGDPRRALPPARFSGRSTS